MNAYHLNDVIIVGAGPAGLATAIAATRSGLQFRIFEKGLLVNALYHFPTNMVFFTTPELLEIGGLPFVTPYEKPTRVEALRYYRRVTDTFGIDISFDREVTAILRDRVGGEDVFAVETRSTRRETGVDRSRTVVLAIGAYDHPNLLHVSGEDLPHVSHYYKEAHAYYRKRVVIVGGKNSAAEAALELFRSGAHVTIVHRRAQLSDSIKYWVRPDIDNRIKEGSIAARFTTRVVEITPTAVRLESSTGGEWLAADAVLLLTGYRADLALLERGGIRLDPVTSVPAHDPDTLETNVPGLFLAGAVVAGVNSGQIFIENGRFHGELVAKQICERLKGSRPATHNAQPAG